MKKYKNIFERLCKSDDTYFRQIDCFPDGLEHIDDPNFSQESCDWAYTNMLDMSDMYSNFDNVVDMCRTNDDMSIEYIDGGILIILDFFINGWDD